MPKDKVITSMTFNGHPVIEAAKGSFKYSDHYLKNNEKLLDNTLERHNKVYCYRVDLKYPNDYPEDNSNDAFKHCMSTYTKELSREGLDPQYVARREQIKSHHPHYHVHMCVNGNKRKDYKALTDKMVPHWSRALNIDEATADNLIHRCDRTKDGKPQKNGTMIRRNSEYKEDQYNQVFKQMSYLAKIVDEDITPSDTKKIFYSQYKRKKSRSTS